MADKKKAGKKAKKAEQKAREREAKQFRDDLEALTTRVALLEEAIGALVPQEPVVAPTEHSVPVSIEPERIEQEARDTGQDAAT